MENPLSINTGYTPDISKFRFHIWEPIWYFVPDIKAPLNNLRPARWLGFANSSRDDMNYYIWTENDPKRNKNGQKQERHRILISSVIRNRRKNIGKENEYINDDPAYSNFSLTPTEISVNDS